jgi:geranylgeranyl diphosphate synthase type I
VTSKALKVRLPPSQRRGSLLDFESFKKELRLRQTKVDRFISDFASIIETKSFREASLHLVGGGKRMRPALTLFACGATGGEEDQCIPIASAVEILNTYTLIHDDIIDKDETRRGVQTVHVKFDVPTAILAGDALHSMAILCVPHAKASKSNVDTLLDVTTLLDTASLKICEGQFKDMALQTRLVKADEEKYTKMVELKTAYLFQTAAEVGALIGSQDKTLSGIFREYGHAIGIGFQIQDDILGIVADEKTLQKPLGSDIREGKMSLPVIHFLNNADSSRKSRFEKVFGKEVSRDDVEMVKDLFSATGSLDYAESRAKFYARLARTKMNEMSLNDYYRDLLETFIAFSIRRDY